MNQWQSDNSWRHSTAALAFSPAERRLFWQRKWLREHIALLAAVLLLNLLVLITAWLNKWAGLIGLCPLIWLASYFYLRNKMMIYVEDKTYRISAAENEQKQ